MKRILRSHVRKGCILTLKSGESFKGVLFDADRESFVFRNVEALKVDHSPVPLDGELLVLRQDVAFVQFA